MKVQALIANMTGGEISPRLKSRPDIKKYGAGLRTLLNGYDAPHAGARKRPGSLFVLRQRSDSEDVRLVLFQFSTEQTYCLLFGPGYMWIFKDRGIVTNGPLSIASIAKMSPAVVTTTTPHGLTTGDSVILQTVGGMTELNNQHYRVTVMSATSIQLDGCDATNFASYTGSGTLARIVTLATNYGAADIADMQFAQVNDVLYISHPRFPLTKLSRYSHTSWTLSQPTITTGPFRTINSDRSLKITPSGWNGTETSYGTHLVGHTCSLTASTGIFTPGMVGGLLRLSEEGGETGLASAPVGDSTKSIAVNDVYTYEGNIYGVSNVVGITTWEKIGRVPDHNSGTVRVYASISGGGSYFDADFLHPGYCVVKITGYVSAQVVTVEIVRYQMPRSIVYNGSSFWEEGAWNSYRGFPRTICFFEQRMMLGGSASDPTVIWGSRSAAYEDFEDGTKDGDAIVYRLSSGSADVIRWMIGGRVLTAGTSFGEYAVAASSQNDALTPTNFRARVQTTYGTSAALPVRIGQAVLYPQRAGIPQNPATKLREFSYSFQNDAFGSVDISIFAEHITGPGFDQIAVMLEPDSMIMIRRVDGLLAGCTYEKEQEVVAWHRHAIGGNGVEVRGILSIPGADGDELWMSVRRLVNGQVRRYIEVLPACHDDDISLHDARMLDCHVSYRGVPVSTLSGLNHLAGDAVKVVIDGTVNDAVVGSDGRIDISALPLPDGYHDATEVTIVVGYPYKMIIETQALEAGARAGTAQSRQQKISKLFMRLLNSGGGTYGTTEEDQQPIYYRTASDAMGRAVPLYSGFCELAMPSGWERDQVIRIEHDDPLPFFVTGIVAEINTSG